MNKVDKSSRIPLYCQLVEIMVQEIESNMKDEDKLLPERELCEKYRVSRATVRQALLELEKEGYIYKVHGVGTFVAPKKLNQPLIKFYSFTEEMKKIGKKPSSKVIKFEIMSCEKKISTKLNISEGDEVYKFVRLRMADDRPMMLETTYVPYARFPGITKSDLEKEAMYDIFARRFAVSITSAEEYFQPVSTNEDEAKYLKISKEIPSLKIERFTYEMDRIIEYTRSIARGDKFKYYVKLER